MPNQIKPTLDEVINEFIDECYPKSEAKQAILRYFADRYIGEDVEMMHSDETKGFFDWQGYNDDARKFNQYKDIQRAKLKEDGLEAKND